LLFEIVIDIIIVLVHIEVEKDGVQLDKSEIEKMFNIKDIEYKIEIEETDTDKEGYTEEFTNARTTFNNGYTEVNKMVFFVQNINNGVNRKFSKLSLNSFVFNRVVDI
jgi:hypothetical protein